MYVGNVRGRWRRSASRLSAMRLLALSLTVILVASGTASASGAAAADLPAKVLPFVGEGRTVLAYQSSAAPDLAETNIAFVTRYPSPHPNLADDELQVNYVCELVVLRETAAGIRISGRTTEAVACMGNDKNRGAGYRQLDENLILGGNELTFKNYGNSTRSGWFSYSFRYEGGRWRLSGAKASWSGLKDGFPAEIDESIGDGDIRRTYMEDFTQAGLNDVLEGSRKEEVDYRDLVVTQPILREPEPRLRKSYKSCRSRSESTDFFALIDCADVEYAFQDKRLNNAYRRLMRSLDEKPKAALREEERDWIRARDSYCNSTKFGGVTASLIIAECYMDQAALRAEKLGDMLRSSIIRPVRHEKSQDR